MGVYSNLAASYVKENAEIEAMASASPAQFLKENNEDRFAMFNAVMECDMAYAYNEAGFIALTEAQTKKIDSTVKKGLGKRIIEAIQKFFKWIGEFFKKAIDKIMVLAHKDEGVYDKYKNVITAQGIKKAKLTGEIPVAGAIGSIKNYIHNRPSGLYDALESAVKHMEGNGAQNAEEVTSASKAEDLIKQEKDIQKQRMSALGTDGELGLSKWLIKDQPYTKVDLTEMSSVIQSGYKKTISEITGVRDAVIAHMQELQAAVKGLGAEADTENGSDAKSSDAKYYNAIYEVISMEISTATKESNVAVSVAYSIIAAYRRIWFQLGKALKPAEDAKAAKAADKEAKKAAKEKSAEEVEGEAYVIGMASDYCVESCLGELCDNY